MWIDIFSEEIYLKVVQFIKSNMMLKWLAGISVCPYNKTKLVTI